jgi:prepilin-type N-terminal cleavage/methylation domain-containing protein
MQTRCDESNGFSLVEVVVAMFLLGIIALAFLPPLWQGIRFSSEQAITATATRQLNALVERARAGHSCEVLDGLAPSKFLDGEPQLGSGPYDVDVSDVADYNGDGIPSEAFVCIAGTANTIVLTAKDAEGDVLAVVSAKILVDS